MVVSFTFSVSLLSDALISLSECTQSTSFNLYSQNSEFTGIVTVTVGEVKELCIDKDVSFNPVPQKPLLKKSASKTNSVVKKSQAIKSIGASGK